MILEIPEETERCLSFTIPEEDDAHVVFLAIPGQDAEEDEENVDWTREQKELEDYFTNQMAQMEKYKVRNSLPRKFPEQPPENISKLMSKFLNQYDGELKAFCKITVATTSKASSRNMETFWFTPIVINHLRKSLRGRDSDKLDGYEFCFENSNEDSPVQIVVETVYTSGPETGEDDDGVAPVFESSHLTPLAEQLEEGIRSANTVLNEMRYMEGRERRMRQTADSINARVQYFSYISIGVLILVTYVQVTYLKRYFRKKKLL